jgi:Phage tail protein
MTRWLWTAPDGTITDLSAWSAGTYVVADGTSGQIAPPYEFATQAFAGVDGQTLQQITAQPAAPVLGLDLVASDGAELRSRIRHLAHVLRPRAGMGLLTAAADDDSTSRSLPCYYRKGLETGTHVVTRYRTALEFWSPSPWWRGEQYSAGYSLVAATAFFPIPPVTLSATSITGAATVDLSDTDAPTYPIWTVTGPGSQLTLRNDTTGAVLVLNAAIGDGQTVTIDTRPGQQSVIRNDGLSLFGSLASDPAMWPLVDGINEVSVLLAGAGAASRVDVVAERLYSGAL